jgi:hypothetical protein
MTAQQSEGHPIMTESGEMQTWATRPECRELLIRYMSRDHKVNRKAFGVNGGG